MLNMCTMVLRFGQVQICSSDRVVPPRQPHFDTIGHDSEHDRPTWMRDQTDRSVFFMKRKLPFLDRDIINL